MYLTCFVQAGAAQVTAPAGTQKLRLSEPSLFLCRLSFRCPREMVIWAHGGVARFEADIGRAAQSSANALYGSGYFCLVVRLKTGLRCGIVCSANGLADYHGTLCFGKGH